jgi:hypothetical protein
MKKLYINLLFIVCGLSVSAQVITREDSLNAGLVRSNNPTVISGYGEASYKFNTHYQTGIANLDRVVVFLGHRFSKKISFFSETEIENAKVTSKGGDGEISLEQAFLKFNANKDLYVVAGLFLPRIGIINENHLPTTFNSVARPQLETQLIPSTWRELGVGIYYNVPRIPGLNLSACVVNGLSAQSMGGGQGIVNAKFEGSNATGSNIAVNAAVLYYYKKFRFQVSGYYGGSVGLSPRSSDSLKLNSGAFGTPVGLFEANAQYLSKGFYVKALGCLVTIPDAQYINRAYANNTASTMSGFYVEAGFNVLYKTKYEGKKLNVFGRYESFDLNTSVPTNGIRNDAWRKQYIAGGVSFQPIQGVLIKADVQVLTTGNYNQTLIINPNPSAAPYVPQQTFVELGIAYSF